MIIMNFFLILHKDQPPLYRNDRLIEMISENRTGRLDLSEKCLDNNDMEIVAYYALRINKVIELISPTKS